MTTGLFSLDGRVALITGGNGGIGRAIALGLQQAGARVAVVNSVQDYWTDALPAMTGIAYQPSETHTFTDATSTGCGQASSQVGPFYCPQDDTVYLDTGFFDEVLEKQLGGPDGGFVEAYVLGHEYGHHIQDLTGTMGQVRSQQGANSDAVRLELQADCYAGMWARNATSTEDATGQVLISELTDEDIQLAIEAAETVGDDRIQRKTSRPFFIDKMPNNFAHVGMIQLILPNAKIIDTRRHPLGCCFSCFKQHFARGQAFTYDLAELGAYYRDYVELMAHFDAVLPGRVHRVFYERMVEDTETEVRRLLDYCGLPFEEGVLRFHENKRAVRTASSEQVRQPIFREGLDQWRHFDAWLEPLRQSLGPVLDHYPSVPQF